MIERISLKFGKTMGSQPEVIDTTSITVFVGPNNSGKSKVLQELQRYCTTGQLNTGDVIVSTLDFKVPDNAEVDSMLNEVSLDALPNETVPLGNVIIGKKGQRQNVSSNQLRGVLSNPASNLNLFGRWYLGYNTLMLNGPGRINLVQDQALGDLQQPPSSSFQFLFRNDDLRKEVRRIIHDAFGEYFVLDPTSGGQLRIRLSNTSPSSDIEERGIHQEAVAFHAAAQHIAEASDGVKAFTGMITEIIAGDPLILLIDEPEAFLHPALSYKLGFEISQARIDTNKRIFVSTHSSNFVMGCIQSGAEVNIVRLTYRGGSATARVLPNSDILRLMRNPLLRSTGVMSALFYEYVVVTESDTDRAFYQEVNERLCRYMPELGVKNCLFLNAQNKQTVKNIIKPLRDLGIPTAAIVDIDILKEGGTVWTSFMNCATIPELDQVSMSTSRLAIKNRFTELGLDMKREGGVSALEGQDKEATENLLDRLGQYGLFVVPDGELESWLSDVGATGHGPSWLLDIFEAMGEDPDSIGYIKPDLKDVWQFIGKLKSWFIDPAKKGIPV